MAIAVDMERWIDGTLVGGSRVYGASIEEVRGRLCPKDEGWIYVADEGRVAAHLENKTYLFVPVVEVKRRRR